MMCRFFFSQLKSGVRFRFRAVFFLVFILAVAYGIAFLFRSSWEVISESSPPQLVKQDVSSLTTLYRNKALYKQAFADAEKDFLQDADVRTNGSPDRDQVHAMVTSHHFLVAPLIARSYAAVTSSAVKRIILVSPDHFQSNFPEGSLAFTTDVDWDGLFGNITSDKEFISRLAKEYPQVRNTKTPFLGEHGIYTEIPFLAHYFPQASIVPLILKNTYTYSDFEELGKLLRLSVKESAETLLVVSSDFSHHATHASARISDSRSIRILENLDGRRFDDLDNDCRSCIALLAGYLDVDQDSVSFRLIENRDSTEFGGEDRDVTSYVSGYFISSKVRNVSDVVGRKPVTLLFGGDIMLDRYIRTVIRRSGGDFVFHPLAETLEGADMVIANLEGPITDHASVSEQSIIGEAKNYVFTFDPENASLLKRKRIGIVNLGNNHILNFREDGARQTEDYLRKAGVEYFGSPLAGGSRALIRTFRGVRVAFVNYNQFMRGGQEKAFEDLRTVRPQADVVILYTHWGREYVPVLPAVRELAHRFVDAGADVIIGSHPHIVQEQEAYHDKTIYYSLGNFVFDQYAEPATQSGLLVSMAIDPVTHALSFHDIPIAIKKNGQTMLAPQD